MTVTTLSNCLCTFIRYNKRWSFQALAFLIATTSLFFYNLHFHLKSNRCITYALARSCGSILKWCLMPSIILPISRVIFTLARNSRVGKYLGLDRRLADHQLFAYGASFFAIVHMLAHLLYKPSSFKGQSGITGLIMLLSLALPLSGVFLMRRYFRVMEKYSYSTQILRPHQLGAALFIAAYSLHTPDGRLLYFSISMYGTYLLDRILEHFFFTYYTKIRKATKITNTQYILLSIDRPSGFRKTLPGQYALFSFPEIDAKLECFHPFTIFSDDGNTLIFLIRRAGRWTCTFSDLINEEQNGRGLKIVLIGPYGSTLNIFYDLPSLTLIGSGIGLTMPFSFLNHNFNNNHQMPKLEIHISQRTVNEFIPCITTLNNINDKNTARVTIHFYLTSALPSSDCYKLFNALNGIGTSNKKIMEFHFDNHIINTRFRSKDSLIIYVHLGRPDLEKIVRSANVVGICGNPMLMKEVYSLSLNHGKKCYQECF